MRTLIVVAHPLTHSLCARLAVTVEATLKKSGHEVEVLDLYKTQFPPALRGQERLSYYDSSVDPGNSLDAMHEQLRRAEVLVLVFLTWWFSMPAILKGWFDRVWWPGVAFDHGTPIQPLLTSLRACLAVTTLGSPWWVDWLIMQRPVGRVIRRGILLACAPNARFRLLSLHAAENVAEARLSTFEARISRALSSLVDR